MTLRDVAKAVARRAPLTRSLLARRDALLAAQAELRASLGRLESANRGLQAELDAVNRWHRFVPPGHFYDPMTDLAEIEREWPRIAPDPPPRTLPGIDLREAEQLALLDRLAPWYPALPFTPEPQPGLRYHYENGAYSYGDAICLALMLRHLRPRRVVEIGSGHSSCVILDVTERYDLGTALTCIEPYPDLLLGKLRDGDAARFTLLRQRVQDVPLDVFTALGANDLLLVDSTHVGKVGSDVNHIFAHILPALRPDVAVHVHDIFYPFEYPLHWFVEGRAWNEAYMLHRFLTQTSAWDIVLWNDFLVRFHADRFARAMPLVLRNPGASLWLQRRA